VLAVIPPIREISCHTSDGSYICVRHQVPQNYCSIVIRSPIIVKVNTIPLAIGLHIREISGHKILDQGISRYMAP
jgi:hypothetical protein